MKVEQLKQFLEVVQCGSINKAAQKTYIAHSTLSASIKALETELGKELFFRSNKGIVLTPFGTEVYNQASLICAQMDFLSNISKPDAEPIQYLSVAHTYVSAATYVFMSMCKRGYSSQTHFSIQELPPTKIMKNVKMGLSEIGIMYIVPLLYRPILQSGLEYHKLCDRDLHILVGPNNPLYYNESDFVKKSDLDPYPYVTYYDVLSEAPYSATFAGDPSERSTIAVSSSAVLSHIIYETQGFTFENKNHFDYYMYPRQKPLRALTLDEDMPKGELGYICLSEKSLTPLAQEFIDDLCMHFEALDTKFSNKKQVMDMNL